MKLYEISQEYESLADLVEAIDSQEDADAFTQLSAAIADQFATKAQNIGCLIRNCKAEAEQIDAEIDRLKGRKAALENRAERVKDYLAWEMRKTGQEKVQTPLFSFYFQKSPDSVEADVDHLPLQFVKITKAADKTAIKDALKSGPVEGARLVEGEYTLRIK